MPVGLRSWGATDFDVVTDGIPRAFWRSRWRHFPGAEWYIQAAPASTLISALPPAPRALVALFAATADELPFAPLGAGCEAWSGIFAAAQRSLDASQGHSAWMWQRRQRPPLPPCRRPEGRPRVGLRGAPARVSDRARGGLADARERHFTLASPLRRLAGVLPPLGQISRLRSGSSRRFSAGARSGAGRDCARFMRAETALLSFVTRW